MYRIEILCNYSNKHRFITLQHDFALAKQAYEFYMWCVENMPLCTVFIFDIKATQMSKDDLRAMYP